MPLPVATGDLVGVNSVCMCLALNERQVSRPDSRVLGVY